MPKVSTTRKKVFSLNDKWTTCDLNQKAFCARYKIKYCVFHYWYKRYSVDKAVPGDPSTFVSIHFDSAAGAYAEFVMPNGKRLLFHQPTEVN